MSTNKTIKNALISVYHKEGLAPIIKALNQIGAQIWSTGGTSDFIKSQDIPVHEVEALTGFPHILGGRVKTLHPHVFGGILARQNNAVDLQTLEKYNIPLFDLVIVDLYPFAQTLADGGTHEEIIEKIDIGGISLIRAAAKNYADVIVVSSRSQYIELLEILLKSGGESHIEQRKKLAAIAFQITNNYDTAISDYLLEGHDEQLYNFRSLPSKALRYGENPHQKAKYYGHFNAAFKQLSGKELSYNNLLDVDAALALMSDLQPGAVAILKHNNACGAAVDENQLNAWEKALAGDPISAFGGVIIANKKIHADVAQAMHELFFEVLIAPDFSDEALQVLQQKTNRILLQQQNFELPTLQFRTLLNGVIEQDRDMSHWDETTLKVVTKQKPNEQQMGDLAFANVIVKHSKSNAIVLVKNKQLIASGVGMTSRIDALQHAINKAKALNQSLQGAVMASDAFFPFPDCVELAHQEGIKAVIQPGGSIKDQLSLDFCDAQGIAMVTTGVRHFKH